MTARNCSLAVSNDGAPLRAPVSRPRTYLPPIRLQENSSQIVLDWSCIIVQFESMNKLSTDERTRMVAALVEGNSMRAISRMTGVSRNTVDKLLVDLGGVCSAYQDKVFAISRASAFNAMRFGHSSAAKKRTLRRRARRTAGATFGHGLRSTPIRNSFLAGSSVNVTRAARIISSPI